MGLSESDKELHLKIFGVSLSLLRRTNVVYRTSRSYADRFDEGKLE